MWMVIYLPTSLGGAVAVRVAASQKVLSLVGVMVIDVVEGTAIASLGHMHAILDKRPSRFRSYKDAITWSLHSNTVRNPEAANVSIPSQLTHREDGSLTWRTDLKSSSQYWRGKENSLMGGLYGVAFLSS